MDQTGHKTIVELFEAQVRRSPHNEAVRHGARALSYAQLNERANQMAARLRSLGAAPERLVTVYMEHSIEVVCAILGILKAGAAFVPVDPCGTPRERLEFLLEDLSPAAGDAAPGRTLLITQPEFLDRIPPNLVEVVTLDADFASIDGEPPDDPPRAASPRNLAYVIYTSGSTGKPKGVLIEHRSFAIYIEWAAAYFCDGEELTWPLFSSLAFDLTVTSLFAPLVSGGRIVVYREPPEFQVMAVLKVMEEGVADIVKLTPSHLAMIKDLDLSGSRIRKLIVGGEEFKVDLAREISRSFGRPVEIYNEYGPTEATVGCMIHRYDPLADNGAAVPIGTPMAGARVYILDEHLSPVPSGVMGEVYLAGDGVARGYLNRPELTAQSFPRIDDPWQVGPDPRARAHTPRSLRLYKTGDVARWNASKYYFEFLGRVDSQVKLGGVRIEPGEIEACLKSLKGVRDSVVAVVREAPKRFASDAESEFRGARRPANEQASAERLVAYYVSERPLDPRVVHAHLSGKLPGYMVPEYIVWLEKLPLTSNGKIDRRGLPQPRPKDQIPADPYEWPRS